jgi:hypothetical protein
MNENVFDKDERKRRVAWEQILRLKIEEQKSITRRQLQKLAKAFLEESEPAVKDLARDVLVGLLCAGVREEPAQVEQQKLATWFSRPFRSPSLVITAFDPNHRRRDEIAVIDLARHFSNSEYPRLSFLAIPLGFENWGDVLANHERVSTVCVIGRLGMYGPEALKQWGSDETRLYFPYSEYPPKHHMGVLDPEFHRITERVGGSDAEVHHIASENHRERTDFGVVQRYTCWSDVRPITVIICAGCSALGTLGAVRWMIELKDSPIEMPQDARREDCFEALIEVKADTAKFPRIWRPKPKRLLKLYYGNRQWVQGEVGQKWLPRAPQEITVSHGPDGSVTEVLLDGDRAGPRCDTVIFRLLTKLCDLTADRPGAAVQLSHLAQQKHIWDGNTTDVQNVRRRLGQLRKQYLGTALRIRDAEVCLDTRVRIVVGVGRLQAS